MKLKENQTFKIKKQVFKNKYLRGWISRCVTITNYNFNLAEWVVSKPKVSTRLLLYKRFDSAIVMSKSNFSKV